MTHACLPHDFLWLDSATALVADSKPPDWLHQHWHPGLPVVVRRARARPGLIAIGIRGSLRAQRCALWVNSQQVCRVLSPEQVAAQQGWRQHPRLAALPALQALQAAEAALQASGLVWGITGSAGYELATGQATLNNSSDLDLLLRCPQPPAPSQLAALATALADLPCRVDIQLQTPAGGMALAEYLRGGPVLLKTDDGPVLLDSPLAAWPASAQRVMEPCR
ncbi:malonate decarboxylase holo-ACP synthase [Aquitalea sp. LB_tupeE]|uniref:malonate decarboxylase holo-ACP synthase n=1 Tax=Aquitalea sp. LB_tupeE TaxID=2748078 RepID=UPI0015BDC830|nr:malonate decarboxylase holo-ACP synthase [Aquitalea sp. LB_tupeE]NWK79720.1 malonate decarboxylase holo-ACP synthase [Aquitalea sp. LB_tupeE]